MNVPFKSQTYTFIRCLLYTLFHKFILGPKIVFKIFGFDLNFGPKNPNIHQKNWANFGQKLWTFYRVWSLTESQLAYRGSTSMSFTSNPVLIMRKHMIIWSLGPRCIRSFLLCFVAFGTRPTKLSSSGKILDSHFWIAIQFTWQILQWQRIDHDSSVSLRTINGQQ